MAANGARRTLQFSLASAKTLLTRSTTTTTTTMSNTCPFATKAAGFSGLSPKPSSASRFSHHKLNFSRLPVELGGASSLIPLHSVTASALFTSLLSLHNNTWGCLSEGFATPL